MLIDNGATLDFQDVWAETALMIVANEGYTEILFGNSYHGFTGVANNHWDYMFWKEKNGDDIEFKKAYVMEKEGTINESRKHYISDHFPIYAEFFHKNIK